MVLPAPGIPVQNKMSPFLLHHVWNSFESRSHCPVPSCRRLRKSLCCEPLSAVVSQLSNSLTLSSWCHFCCSFLASCCSSLASYCSLLVSFTSLYVVAPSTAVSMESILFSTSHCPWRFSTDSRMCFARKAPFIRSHPARYPLLLFSRSFNRSFSYFSHTCSISFASVVLGALGPS